MAELKTWRDEFELCDGAVIIGRYRRRYPKSKTWYYRFWVPGIEKMITRSTKTRDRSEATQIATDAWYDARARIRANRPVIDNTWSVMFERYRKEREQELQRNNHTKGYNDRLLSALTLYVERFFSKKKINDLTQDGLDDFWNWRIAFWTTAEGKKVRDEKNIRRVAKDPSVDQLKECIPVLKRMIELAKGSGDLPDGRDLKVRNPKKAKRQNTGEHKVPHLTREQWHKYHKYLPIWGTQINGKNGECLWVNRQYRRRMFRVYFELMTATGMRMQSAQLLKWRHVNYQSAGLSFTAQGKNHKYFPVAPSSIAVLLSEWRNDPDNHWTDASDHVFVWANGLAPEDEQFDSLFKQLQKTMESATDYSGVTHDNDDRLIKCNSFRHTYAVWHRMYFGTKIEDIADQMGNTHRICHKHYAQIKPIYLMDELAKELSGDQLSLVERLEEDEMLCQMILSRKMQGVSYSITELAESVARRNGWILDNVHDGKASE
ncbi:MAG: hypothetical protein HON65_00365 [Rhodospirillales bacterium]|jgi:integrase|nr:hypothetical protein [Rhodospirillales bacterium]